MRLALTLTLALTVCATRPHIPFNEGKPRIQCKAEFLTAVVGKPWPWACTIAGDLAPFAQTPIGIEIVTKYREPWPTRSIVGEGLKRVYPYKTTFETEYYLDLTGNSRPTGRVEILRPGDPTAPPEPIEGIENSLDGSFWMEITFYEIVEYDPATQQISVKPIGKGRVNGRLTCPQCSV